MPAFNLPPSDRSKWIYVVMFVACGLGVASKAPDSVGPIPPLLLISLWAVWLKVMLEFAWELPVRVLFFMRFGSSRAERIRAVLGVSIVAVVVSFLIVRDSFL